MPQVTNKQTPKGGVHIPMVRFTATTRPKCMRSMFKAFTNGRNKGTKIVIALVVSINVPAMSRIMLITMNAIQGDVM